MANTVTISGSIAQRFHKMFGAEPRVLRAPGRVNLIGEHTDYNDGFVMPAAIGYYTRVAVGKRNDFTLEAYSAVFDEKVRLSLDALAGPPTQHWSDFIRGLAATLQTAGHGLVGMNLLIDGDIPLGAGLSSSASLEMAAALAMTSISGVNVPRLELVKLCQKTEHQFVGTLCGIMDQFVTAFGRTGHSLMLDCRSLEHWALPIPRDLRLVLCNSMVKHRLASGEYNRRRSDCDTGVTLLQAHLPGVRALRDIRLKDLESHKAELPATIHRRCHHVVSENQRVQEAAAALQSGDLGHFGQLMYRSHASLRDDFDVSCRELDLLVELASAYPGVYGARMTGGGFGGCTVNLVRAQAAVQFQEHIRRAYRETVGTVPDVYICEAVQGAEVWH